MIEDAFGMPLVLDAEICASIFKIAAQQVADGLSRDTSCYAIDEAYRKIDDLYGLKGCFEQPNLKGLFASYFKPIGSSSAYWFEEVWPPTPEIIKEENDHRVIALLLMAEICKGMEIE
jgi:hypothetical protein